MASVRNRDDLAEIYMYHYAQYSAHYNNSHHRMRKTMGHMGNLHNSGEKFHSYTTRLATSLRQIHPYSLDNRPDRMLYQCIVHWNNDIQS